MRLLIWPEGKREKESQTIWHQKAISSFYRELLLNRIRGQNWRHDKGFVTRFLNSRKTVKARSFPRNKSKIKWKPTTEILPRNNDKRNHTNKQREKDFVYVYNVLYMKVKEV